MASVHFWRRSAQFAVECLAKLGNHVDDLSGTGAVAGVELRAQANQQSGEDDAIWRFWQTVSQLSCSFSQGPRSGPEPATFSLALQIVILLLQSGSKILPLFLADFVVPKGTCELCTFLQAGRKAA